MTKITIPSWIADPIRDGSKKARAMDQALRQRCKDNKVETPDRHPVGRRRAQFMQDIRFPMPGDEKHYEEWCREARIPHDQFMAIYALIYK